MFDSAVVPKVSIVVPIYGVEKYLNECVDSILNQTLRDIEVILVDDGSKDRCPEMVDEYAAKDPRVVAIHQPNGGYGRAVNHGIEVARGEYIGIIESDDWIEPTMYEKLYSSAKEYDTDITKCSFYIYNSQLKPEEQNREWIFHSQNLHTAPDGVFTLKDYPLIVGFHASIWANLYRADFIKQQKVVETRSASYQDFPFMIEAMCRANRLSVVKEPLVHYRMEDSQDSSTKRNDARLLIMPDQCNECKRLLKQYGKHDALIEEFYFHAFLACNAFYQIIQKEYKHQFFTKYYSVFKELKKYPDFQFKYFNPIQEKECRKILKGSYIWSLMTKQNIRNLRRFLFCIHQSSEGCCFQFFGIQYATGKYMQRPAYIQLNKKNND
jgi:glycosyltransferase involved in cell wall biosynthesis